MKTSISIISVIVFVSFFPVFNTLLAKDVEFNGFSLWMPDDYIFHEFQDEGAIAFESKSNTMRVVVVKSVPQAFGIQKQIDKHKDLLGTGNWSEPKLSTINGLNAYMSISLLHRPEGIFGGTIIYFCVPGDTFGSNPTITLLLMASGTERDIRDTSQIIQSVKLISK